jgi:hypothetical protein
MNYQTHWSFIYHLVLEYPDKPDFQVAQNYKETLLALQYVIPDLAYRAYYAQYIRQHFIESHLESKHQLLVWVMGLHPGAQVSQHIDLWGYLLAIVHGYPIKPTFQEILYYKNFFISLQNTLPQSIRNHYVSQINSLPPDSFMTSKKYMIAWINRVSNPEAIVTRSVEGFAPYHTYHNYHGMVLVGSGVALLGLLFYVKSKM